MTRNPRPDFSQKATNKVVLQETLQHPLTLAGAAFGVLGGLATVLFDGGIGLALVAGSGAAVGLGSFLVNYFGRGKTFADRHLRKMHEQLLARQQQALLKLRADLEQLGDIPGAEQYVKQGRDQFAKAQKKYSNFEQMLGEKLGQHELTYGRYLGTAEQVYLALLDNLLEATHRLAAIQEIDLNYIDERRATLSQQPSLAEADQAELATLAKRADLRQTQIDLVNALMTANEEALTALDLATAAVTQLQTGKGRAAVALDEAMGELQVLAGRVREY